MFDGLDHSVQGLYVAPVDLVRWVDRVRPHLEKMAAGSDGCYETVDLLAAIASGEMLLWLVLDGAEIACVMLTQIVQYPRKRAMRCIGISGTRPRRWMPLLADVERASKAHFGCDKMQALHTPRHAALLQTGGWRQFHILSVKDL